MVVTAIVFVVSIWGYQLIHTFERYCWIACVTSKLQIGSLELRRADLDLLDSCLIIFTIILGLGSKGGYQTALHTATMDTGDALIGDVLSFAGCVSCVRSRI